MIAVLMNTPVPITVPTTRAVVAGSDSPRTRRTPSSEARAEVFLGGAEELGTVMSPFPCPFPLSNRLAPFDVDEQSRYRNRLCAMRVKPSRGGRFEIRRLAIPGQRNQ